MSEKLDANPTFHLFSSHPLNGLLYSAAPVRGATMPFGFKPLSPAAAGSDGPSGIVFAARDR